MPRRRDWITDPPRPRQLNGSAGGIARALKLTPEERSAIGRKAAAARWEPARNAWFERFFSAGSSAVTTLPPEASARR